MEKTLLKLLIFALCSVNLFATQSVTVSGTGGTLEFPTAAKFSSANGIALSATASAAAPVQSVAGRTGSVTLSKSDVGLGNVDNTSDVNKPISASVQSALTSGTVPGVDATARSSAATAQSTANAAIPATNGTGINTVVSGMLTVLTETNTVLITGSSVKINGVEVGGNPFDQSLNAGENVTFGIITGALVGNADTATNANFSNHTGSVDLGDFFSDVGLGNVVPGYVQNATNATNATSDQNGHVIGSGDYTGLGGTIDNAGFASNAGFATHATYDENGVQIGGGDYTGFGGTIDFANRATIADSSGVSSLATFFNATDASVLNGMDGSGLTSISNAINAVNASFGLNTGAPVAVSIAGYVCDDTDGVQLSASFANNAGTANNAAFDFVSFFGGVAGYTLNGSNGDFLQSNGNGSLLSGVIHTLASGSNVTVTSGTVSVTGLTSGTLSKLTVVTGTINLTNGVISGGLFSGGTLNNVTIGGVTTVSGTVSGNIVRSGTTIGGVFSSGTFGGDGSGFTNLPMQLYSGSFSGVGTATTAFVVTIGTTQANTNYKVNVTPTAALSAALFYISAKTTTTFTVTYLAGLTGTVTFDWSVFP